MRGRHLLPSQLPGEHTDHKAASRHSEPTWNAHYSSTHHQCWYSFTYLQRDGWLSQPPARLSWELVLNLGPVKWQSAALLTELSQPVKIQIQNGKPKLIAYASKRLPEAAQNYSITELEMWGLSINVASFTHMLKRVEFDAIVYHLALTHIIKSKADPKTIRIRDH